MKKVTVPFVRSADRRLSMLTAYDYTMACLVDRCGVDMVLVGDSLGMVVQGKSNTLGVNMEHMIYHCKAVVNGVQNALVVGDMPYLSYHVSTEDTVRNAGRLIAEAGCDAVKLEGGTKRIPMIKALVDAEIPVMGHLGLTPQSVNVFGGFKVQGKQTEQRKEMIQQAKALQDAGVFSLVLECVPFDLAKEITESLEIPTIGIGAGPFCRGQVLVTPDLLGMTLGPLPKFVPKWEAKSWPGDLLNRYINEVGTGSFPAEGHCYGVNDQNRHLFSQMLKKSGS